MPVWVPLTNIDHGVLANRNQKEEIRSEIVRQRTKIRRIQDTGNSKFKKAEIEAAKQEIAAAEERLSIVE